MKSLAKNSLFNALYQVLNLLFPLISSMYVARTLMPEGVGRVAYAQNITSYFVTAAALGIPTVGIRVISLARDDRTKLNKSFSELVLLNAISTAIALSIYAVLILNTPSLKTDILLYIATGTVILFNFINIDWFYKGQEEYVYIVIRSIVTKIISIIALFVFVHTPDDYILYAIISSLAICGNYVFNILRSRNYVTFQLRGLNIAQHIKPVLLVAGSLFLSEIYSKLDTTMLGSMIGDESVGYYSYAHKVLQIGIGFCAAITAAFLPRLSYYYENNREQFLALVTQGTRITSFLAIPASVGLFLLAPEAVSLLFGPEFLSAAQTLRIFAILIVVFSFGNLLCYQMMLCSGSEKKHVLILACAATTNIILNSILIPRLQHNGAAVASVCTELFINLVEGIYFKRKLRLRYDMQAIWQAILSTAVMGVCILLVKRVAGTSALAFVFCIISGVCAYAAMNILLKNSLTLEALAIIRNKVFHKGK